jgi:hypothetical protein
LVNPRDIGQAANLITGLSSICTGDSLVGYAGVRLAPEAGNPIARRCLGVYA